ncbi:VOC family protein [Saccharopolyspora rhizosphaerae]|uniref:VOC family protein n=1 Tax=Saccharopolyspora rhizosphaerae TaxID=2492662 RepID=A0A426JZX5_9PSEU|nr:VOC family protein [Saccharopolyspora rhizosphaerae]RRO18621.1 VOC family protein [Saccharopolyspora rhizosphaerae]
MTDVQPIPRDFPRVTPYLFVDDATAALDFYCRVLGATERMRMPRQNGKIAHAEIAIGDSVIMLADEAPEMGARSPKTIGGTPAMLYVYVDDVDRVFEQAVQSGSTVLNPVTNQFYGDRSGDFEDPFGHCWSIATHVEDVSEEEMSRRMTEAMSGG